jgi:hypothetical protein
LLLARLGALLVLKESRFFLDFCCVFGVDSTGVLEEHFASSTATSSAVPSMVTFVPSAFYDSIPVLSRGDLKKTSDRNQFIG